MARYPALPNGAKAKLSDYSWVEITPDGKGTLRCYDGSNDERFGFQVEDLLHLGICVQIALAGSRASFIRKDGQMLSIRPSEKRDGGIDIRGSGAYWGHLNQDSTELLLDFCKGVLRSLGLIPPTLTSFSDAQINALLQSTNVNIKIEH